MRDCDLTGGRVRVGLRDGRLRLSVREGDVWHLVAETGAHAGLRLRTTADVPVILAAAQTTAEHLVLHGRAGAVVCTMTATPRPAEATVDVIIAVTLPADLDVEWFWSGWRFVPGGRPLGGPPAWAWVPHLRPEPEHLIGDHAFRAPALIAADGGLGLALRPALALQAALHPLRCALDYRTDGPTPALRYGIAAVEPEEHMYFRHAPGSMQRVPAGTWCMGYALDCFPASAAAPRPLVATAARTWVERPDPRRDSVAPQTTPWAGYARAAYAEIVRDHFVETPEAGPDTGGVPHWVYPDYIPFQSWFSNLRSGYGLVYWGEALGAPDWVRAGRAMRALWESAPRGRGGLLPTYYHRPSGRWRGVADLSAFGPAFVEAFGDPDLLRWWSMADACWAHLWRLRWCADLEGGSDLPADTAALADFLWAEQARDGSVPSYFAWDTFTAGDTLRATAQTALAVWLWLAAAARRPTVAWGAAAERGARFLREVVVPAMRYEDFETFHSCSHKPEDFTDPVTGLAPQNTLAMQWTAEALFCMWRATGATPWRDAAEEALACLMLYQQVWDAPFLDFDTYGGFGVMNTDAEWSDARQAQFAVTLLRFGDALGRRSLAERGVAALRAAFALMTLPANRAVAPATHAGGCPNWPAEHRLRMFAPELRGRYARMPAGLMVENYGHTGLDSPGVRTAFDWGEGSALTAAAEVTGRYGHVWVHPEGEWAIGIDGWLAESEAGPGAAMRVHVRDGLGIPRPLTVCANGPGRRFRFSRGGPVRYATRGGRTFATLEVDSDTVEFHVE